MNKEFIPYEQALELKKLGFNEPCLGWYRQKEVFISCVGWLSECQLDTNFDENGEDNFDFDQCTAPLKSQALNWLRKKFNWTFLIQDEVNKNQSWGYWISGTRYINTLYKDRPYFNTYEEAELACLKKLIEKAKNK